MAKLIRVFPYSGSETDLPVADCATAVSFYEKTMGFRVVERLETPQKSVLLERDGVIIGLAENGGDPAQNGCFFEVDDVEALFAELKANGLGRDEADFRIDTHGETAYKVFFVIAPDGLCYCLGERQATAA